MCKSRSDVLMLILFTDMIYPCYWNRCTKMLDLMIYLQAVENYTKHLILCPVIDRLEGAVWESTKVMYNKEFLRSLVSHLNRYDFSYLLALHSSDGSILPPFYDDKHVLGSQISHTLRRWKCLEKHIFNCHLFIRWQN